MTSRLSTRRSTGGAKTLEHHVMFQQFLVAEKEEVESTFERQIFPSTVYEDYDFIRIIGEGTYGLVVAARNIHNKTMHAVKIIRKKILLKKDYLRHFIWEIKILNAIKFEFVINLNCYFTNSCFVFVVLPFVDGTPFSKFLKKNTKLNEDCGRFFTGQIVLALEYLHFMGIVYRDLKPDNLVIDSRGYIKIIDCGFAKRLDHKYSYTFCGTPEYIAPEILLSKGYSLSPDWWSLGILIYEMCDGNPPFNSQNHLKLYEKILEGHVNYPSFFSPELKSLIGGFLQVDKTKRLGCMRKGTEDIKFHDWFKSLDWLALWNKKIIPPLTEVIGQMNTKQSFSQKLSFTNCQQFISSEAIENIDMYI